MVGVCAWAGVRVRVRVRGGVLLAWGHVGRRVVQRPKGRDSGSVPWAGRVAAAGRFWGCRVEGVRPRRLVAA